MPDRAPDWPAIRAAAVSVGVRQAARQAARDLQPEERRRFVERVMKRSSREGWITAAASATADAAKTRPSALSAPVRTGSEIIAQTVADQGTLARRNLATAIVSGTDHLAKQSGTKVIGKSRQLKDLAAAGSQVFGWDHGGASLRVNIYADLGSLRAAGDGPVIDV